ncbi:MAG: hypothetical protein U9P14_09100 [Gemmatimonadota bacterium]|nr:hypothetical protein [Gemmatimonadota bacterium]
MTLPAGITKIIVPACFLAFAALTWFGLYEPQLNKSREYRGKLAQLEAKVDAMFKQVGSYEPPTDEERSQWQSLALDIESRISRGRQLSELYAYLSDLAVDNNLGSFNRRLVEGSDSVRTDGGLELSSFDMEVTFDSDFDSLVKLLAGLNLLDRLVEVNQIEVFRKPPVVGVRIILRSYHFS